MEIVIVIESGIVQTVFSSTKSVNVTVIDLDSLNQEKEEWEVIDLLATATEELQLVYE
jgi:hypothetical protein